MSILANLSRRLSMLTSDAKPDPPRINVTENTNNLLPSNSSQGSTPNTPDNDLSRKNSSNSFKQQNSRPSTDSNSGRCSRDKKIPRVKKKSTSTKNGQATNIVNYNIINSNGVKIGATTTYVCNINQCDGGNVKDTRTQDNNLSSKKTSRPMPKDIETLSMSQRELTIEDMFYIKSHISSDWRDTFKTLGYSQGQLDRFEENYKSKGIDEVIYQALVDWKQANGRSACIGIIVKALWKNQQYDCVERLTAVPLIS